MKDGKKDPRAATNKPVKSSSVGSGGAAGTEGDFAGTQLSIEDLLGKIAEARALAEKLQHIIEKGDISDAELQAEFEKELGPEPERRLLEVALNLAGVHTENAGLEEGLAMLNKKEEPAKPRPGRFRKLI